jgi:hypothetical protein
MKTLTHIARYMALAVLLLLLSALAPAKAQNVVRQGETTVIAIEPQPGDTYSWELYNDSTVNFAVVPGTTTPSYGEFVDGTTSSTVTILWKKPGVYFFKVHAMNASGCTDNLKIGIVRVLEALPTATLTTVPICIGETATLTVELTGTGPWSLTYTDGTTTTTVTNIQTSPHEITIKPGPKKTTDYTIISVTDKWGTNNNNVSVPGSMDTQEVNPKPNSSIIYKHEP